MSETIQGNLPDPAIPFANFLRNLIRAIPADDRAPTIQCMINDLAEFQVQLAKHGADTAPHPIFDRAIENVVRHDEQTGFVEDQLDFAVAGMQVLVDLSSTDENRDQRLAQSRKQLRNDLKWLDQVRAALKARETRKTRENTG